MDTGNKEELQDLFKRFSQESEKSIKLVECLKKRVEKLLHKGENIIDPEIQQRIRKQALNELKEIIEKLISFNIELELEDSPSPVIPYFVPGDGTVHKLKFLSGDNPWNFWLVDTNFELKDKIKSLLYKLNNNLLDKVKEPKTAQSVCFVDRNKALRGIVIEIKDQNRVKVVDCDSNLTKIVAIEKLHLVDEDACSVNATALRCTISEVPDTIDLWKNSDLRDTFCKALREATLGVKILKRVAGSFPMFVVDVELHNEEEEVTARLTEWILDRLLPEIKKLNSDENEALCEYLSEESLSPYYKENGEKEIKNSEPQPSDCVLFKNVSTKDMDEELNNLNFPNDKQSEKIVANLDLSKEGINSSEEILNNFEDKVMESTEKETRSSSENALTASSKESLISDCAHNAEPICDSKLNCHSEEFHPKTKKPDKPMLNKKYQNKSNSPQFNLSYPPHEPLVFVPHQVQPPPWPFVRQPLQQVPSWGSFQQPPAWQDQNLSRNDVNIMAPEFVPRNNTVRHPQTSIKVELPKEPITLRKSATLINENENLLVMIAHVENPFEFYVHLVTKSNKHLDKLYEDMFNYYTTREKIEFNSLREARSTLGKYCACKWPRDNHWYRAEVLDWAIGDNLVKVWFVDHGNTECVPMSCLQPLTKTFEKLSICSQACHLAEVYPMIKGQSWSEEAVDFFKSKVEVSDSRVYSITVVQSNTKALKQNSLSVLLYEGKASQNSKSINDLLVEQRLAWSRGLQFEPTSSTSSDNYHSMDDLSDQVTNSLTLDYDPLINPPNSGDNHEKSPSLPESNLFQTSSTVSNGTMLDADFEHWDPLREDFESVRNNIAVDTDDACVAVSGYSARDEARICKLYAEKGFCYKEPFCPKEHCRPNPDGTTTDKEEVYVGAFSQLDLPMPGDVVRLKITRVFDINIFYAQIEESKGVAVDDEIKDDAETLTSLVMYLNLPENVRQMRGLRVPPAPGEMVLAKDDATDSWFRARVCASSCNIFGDDDDIVEVMFVDYGTSSSVSVRNLRKMEARYLHLPFQAIECSLANIRPLSCENENLKRATELLEEVLEQNVFTARVYESFGGETFDHMDILLESEELGDIGDFLIKKGYATEIQLNSDLATACKKSNIFPG